MSMYGAMCFVHAVGFKKIKYSLTNGNDSQMPLFFKYALPFCTYRYMKGFRSIRVRKLSNRDLIT
jgi:hypothetical protein